MESCVGAVLSSSPAAPTPNEEAGASDERGHLTESTDETTSKSLRHHVRSWHFLTLLFIWLMVCSFVYLSFCLSVLSQLFTECQLASKLMTGSKANEEIRLNKSYPSIIRLYTCTCTQCLKTSLPPFLSSVPGGRRQGYMGHLVRITNRLVQCGEGDDRLKESLRLSLGDGEDHDRWEEFVSVTLADLNKRNETNLVRVWGCAGEGVMVCVFVCVCREEAIL